MARVLLSLPPCIHELEVYKSVGAWAPPLGLAYIAAVLENHGHEVRIIDTAITKLDLPKFIHEVKSWRPDVVGLSLLTPTAPKGYLAIKRLKTILPDVPIVVGGVHPTFMYEEALKEGADIVVRGEGEYTMLEIVNIIEEEGLNDVALKHIPGIAFRNRYGKVIVTGLRPPIRDLDRLPWPARHLLPMDKYMVLGRNIRVAHVIASRGCPYNCSFCVSPRFWGNTLRLRSPDKVADEVEYLVDKYKINHVVFADDDLTIRRDFLPGLISEFKKRGLDVNFSCGARINHVNKEFLRYLFRSGCFILYFGVESGSDKTLRRINKGFTSDQALRVFRWIKEVKGSAVASFMIGFPWETLSDMKNTIKFALKIDPDYAQFSIVTPYPGTPLFDYAIKENLIVDRNWEHYTCLKPVMRGFYFKPSDVARMLQYAYLRFYLRPKFLLREMIRREFLNAIWTFLKGCISLFRGIISIIRREE
ncbi:MAG: B12-binding domain-containing radical SAM protein [Thermoprotei archaeon]|nr:MAG: B12-binding domain-containing radical SAM protein [Thermoprotei archaeon]